MIQEERIRYTGFTFSITPREKQTFKNQHKLCVIQNIAAAGKATLN
jgi:hypothetical protein